MPDREGYEVGYDAAGDVQIIEGASREDVPELAGGDGMEAIISHSNTSYMYSESQYGNIRRSVDGGSTWTAIEPANAQEGYWVTPYVMHPTDHRTLYAGYNEIYKTTNYGNDAKR